MHETGNQFQKSFFNKFGLNLRSGPMISMGSSHINALMVRSAISLDFRFKPRLWEHQADPSRSVLTNILTKTFAKSKYREGKIFPAKWPLDSILQSVKKCKFFAQLILHDNFIKNVEVLFRAYTREAYNCGVIEQELSERSAEELVQYLREILSERTRRRNRSVIDFSSDLM